MYNMAVQGTNMGPMLIDSRIAWFGGPLEYHKGGSAFEWIISTLVE